MRCTRKSGTAWPTTHSPVSKRSARSPSLGALLWGTAVAATSGAFEGATVPPSLARPSGAASAERDAAEAAPSDAQQLQAAKNYLLDLDLFHSWVAYVSALVIILYQGNLLTSSRVPWFVVFSAWMLLLSYSSFGIWATLAYKLPSLLRAKWLHTLCRVASGDIGQILVKGLDILSLAAKISIVMSLSTGFVFQGDGVCQVG